jgi:hypothetical protein
MGPAPMIKMLCKSVLLGINFSRKAYRSASIKDE